MTCREITRYATAGELPAQWDELADCIFQKRFFLQHSERYNPCRQRYYILSNDRDYVAAACVYSLGVNLFTFRNIPSRVQMQIIGLPASVSAPGLFGKTRADEEELISLLLRTEKGLILGLNVHPDMDTGHAIPMAMLPTVKVNLPFKNWNEYLHSLRSQYRRRTKRILENFRDVAEIQTACNRFTEAHHALYKQVIEHSSNRLEELSMDYFKNLPEPFQLTSYYHQGRLLCWHIYCHDGDTLYFFFGGHDYRLMNKYQSYFNNLFGIIREAISEGYREIDLGQTAETAKLKTGGEMIPKQLFLYCHNSILRSLIRLCRPLLEYHYPKINYHMFLQSRSSN